MPYDHSADEERGAKEKHEIPRSTATLNERKNTRMSGTARPARDVALGHKHARYKNIPCVTRLLVQAATSRILTVRIALRNSNQNQIRQPARPNMCSF